MASRWRNRKLVGTIDPEIYQKDRAGFLRGLRAIGHAASRGLDTRNAYLIVENDRVVGIGGCRPYAKAKPAPKPHIIRTFPS